MSVVCENSEVYTPQTDVCDTRQDVAGCGELDKELAWTFVDSSLPFPECGFLVTWSVNGNRRFSLERKCFHERAVFKIRDGSLINQSGNSTPLSWGPTLFASLFDTCIHGLWMSINGLQIAPALMPIRWLLWRLHMQLNTLIHHWWYRAGLKTCSPRVLS